MKCAVILVTGPPGAGKSIWVREVVKTLESPVGVIRHCHAKCFQLETAPKPDVEFYAQVYDFGSGCICCTPDGDLIRLLDSVPTLRYLVLETTGLADPRPFLRVFLEEPRILTSYHLQGVVCLIDTRRWRSIEEDIRDGTQYSVDCDVLIGRVKDQLHYADICYLHPPGDLNDTARATLARIYPDLHFSTTRLGEVLRLPECYRPKSKIDSIPIPDMIVHDRTFSTHCVCRCDADIDADILLAQLYQQLTDGEILRVQGFVSVGGTSVADNVISPILLIDGTGPYPTTMRVAPYCVQGNSADVHGTLLDGAWEARTLTGVATKLFFCGSGLLAKDVESKYGEQEVGLDVKMLFTAQIENIRAVIRAHPEGPPPAFTADMSSALRVATDWVRALQEEVLPILVETTSCEVDRDDLVEVRWGSNEVSGVTRDGRRMKLRQSGMQLLPCRTNNRDAT